MKDRIRVNILGLAVDTLTYEDAMEHIEAMVEEGGPHFVCVNSIQDVMIAQEDERFRRIVNNADLATPDGWPVVWAIRANGHPQPTRVTGPDLMLKLCERSVKTGHKHFLYGGAEGVPELLQKKLEERFPGIQIVGGYSPPFRPLTPEEDEDVVKMLSESGADYLWIGLSTPKQHFWAEEHLGRVDIPVMFTVGAAFDFHSGRIERAPEWMRDHHLEWMHRSIKEPKRIGRRYVKYVPGFVYRFPQQYLGLKRFPLD